MDNKWFFLIFGILLAGLLQSCSEPQGSVFGTWELVPEKSTDIVTWRYRQMQVVIREAGEQIVMLDNWRERGKTAFVDSIALIPDAAAVQIPVRSAIWSPNWYMGVLAKPGTVKQVSGKWLQNQRELQVTVDQIVEVSQGDTQVQTTRDLALNHAGDELTIFEKRSSRPTPVQLVFRRAE